MQVSNPRIATKFLLPQVPLMMLLIRPHNVAEFDAGASFLRRPLRPSFQRGVFTETQIEGELDLDAGRSFNRPQL
jgi:hypothetical protein